MKTMNYKHITPDLIVNEYFKQLSPKPIYFDNPPFADKKILREYIKKSLDILKYINMSGGNIFYVIEVLLFIQEEEFDYPERQKNSLSTIYPWEAEGKYPPFFPLQSGDIKKRVGDDFIEVDNPPAFIAVKYFNLYKHVFNLSNEFSSLFFRKGTGAPLSPENVGKRIQWAKARKYFAEYAEEFERKRIGKLELEKVEDCSKNERVPVRTQKSHKQ